MSAPVRVEVEADVIARALEVDAEMPRARLQTVVKNTQADTVVARSVNNAQMDVLIEESPTSRHVKANIMSNNNRARQRKKGARGKSGNDRI